MIDIDLDMNESILLRTSNAARYDGNNKIEFNELVLTDNHLICVKKKSKGLFSKAEIVVDRIPLITIAVINDVVQVELVNNGDYGKVLQMIFTNGKLEFFKINVHNQKEYSKWRATISDAVIRCLKNETEHQVIPSNDKNCSFFGNVPEMKFCFSCGTKLDLGARFCKGCGMALVQTTANDSATQEMSQDEPPADEPIRERRMVYEGEIHKCPNCGEILKSFVVNCPTCGHEFRGAKNSTSVRAFAAKLEEIESTRSTNEFELNSKQADDKGKEDKVSKSDLKKISVIRSFVIPNTKEDLLEFLVMASSNINMQRYISGSISKSESAVSDAWEAKFKQAYEKAKFSFGHTMEFKKIQSLYEKISGEIKQSKKKDIFSNIGIVFLSLLSLSLFAGVAFIVVNSNDRKIATENERLEAIVIEVYDALETENYVLAKAKAATLVFSGPDNYDADKAIEKWDKTRMELLAIIDAAANGDDVDTLKNDESSSSEE